MIFIVCALSTHVSVGLVLHPPVLTVRGATVRQAQPIMMAKRTTWSIGKPRKKSTRAKAVAPSKSTAPATRGFGPTPSPEVAPSAPAPPTAPAAAAPAAPLNPAAAAAAAGPAEWKAFVNQALAKAAELEAAVTTAPSFESHLERAVGLWRGAEYTWVPSEVEGNVPLAVAAGSITLPVECGSTISKVTPTGSDAAQGVKEERGGGAADGGAITLSRQAEGTTFFADGSWAHAPTALSDAEESSLLASPGAFGVSACIAHADGTRRRLLLVLIGGELTTCDVAIEGRAEGGTAGWCYPAASLLEGQLQLVVEAAAWEGGADVAVLRATPPDDASDWTNEHSVWCESREDMPGGAALVPSGAAFLPGGCWAKLTETADAPGEGGGGGDGPSGRGMRLEVGSISLETGVVKVIEHEWEADGRLRRVGLRTVTGKEEKTPNDSPTAHTDTRHSENP